MTRFTFTILEHHHKALREILAKGGSNESVAMILCGRAEQQDPWTGEDEHRFVSHEIIEVGSEYIDDQTPVSVTWSTTPFYNLVKQVASKDYAIAAVHSHPNGPLAFSDADDVSDRELLEIAFNRNEGRKPHLTMIMDGDGNLIARAYDAELKSYPVAMIRIIGMRWSFAYPERSRFETPEALDRQARVFGGAATHDISQLRFGIAGGGGTGSAISILLPRIGARKIALFDQDRVSHTNLNRLHFATQSDANRARLKVDVLADAIAALGLNTSVQAFDASIDEPKVRDAVKSCDVIFGCTDDHLGRLMLNRLAHFYGIPVIDMGLLINRNTADNAFDVFDGRVTVIQPGTPCQLCRGLIDPSIARIEALKRTRSTEFALHRAAGYIPDSGDPSPVVVTFTTELAAMAINELFQRITLFRGEQGSCAERIRRFDVTKEADTIAGGRSRSGCPLCSSSARYVGRGDMTPFLDVV